MSPKPYAFSISAVLAAGLWYASAYAADMRLKPGLWEVTMQSTQDGAAQQMPKLTPQQQAQMEKMGIKMQSGGNSMKIQTCLTKEQVERNERPSRGTMHTRSASRANSNVPATRSAGRWFAPANGRCQAPAA